MSSQFEHDVLVFELPWPCGHTIRVEPKHYRDKGKRKEMRRGRLLPHGYTLLEVLIVVAIVLLVSALTLPTIMSGLSHRQVSESARILQAALAGGATRRFVITHLAAFDFCQIPCLTGSTAQQVYSIRPRSLQPIGSSPSIRACV